MRLQGKIHATGDRVFVHPLQLRSASQENARRYDSGASGATIYAYVGNDPLNLVDPTGEIGVFGATVGAAAEILALKLEGIDVLSTEGLLRVGASAALGATGVGLAGKVLTQLGRLERTAEAIGLGTKVAVNTGAGAVTNAANTAARAACAPSTPGQLAVDREQVIVQSSVGKQRIAHTSSPLKEATVLSRSRH